MKLLLDTHALIWWLVNDPQLGKQAKAEMSAGDNRIFVSPVSAYEMALKHRLGRLPHVGELLADLATYLDEQAFETLPISLAHAQFAGALPLEHRDPFDRLLIAQARIERAWFVSNEALFDAFGVQRLW